ncbi:hypothetical protein AAFC00_001997 [Neodothiora populina]|uniref:Zn(2)-C6 fungal-type domain-containing protein n=1 Tax=Neodothiora populina TaxID=2781224 RepID=A0ABR3PGD4_9PEZI
MTADGMHAAPHAAEANGSAAPKKRRRRAGATGAAEDCFSCRNRQTKCDRRRPYCGQCLEVGKDCSGYKTTLTWGVGVASRGKLRGLSCPVAKETPDNETETKKTAPAPRRKASTSKASRTPKDVVFKAGYTGEFSATFSATFAAMNSPPRPVPPPSSSFPNTIKTELSHEERQPMSLSLPLQHTNWHFPTDYSVSSNHSDLQGPVSTSLDSSRSVLSFLPGVSTQQARVDSVAFPSSAASTSGFSERDYAASIDFPTSPIHMQYTETFPQFGQKPFTGSDVQESGLDAGLGGSYYTNPDDLQGLCYNQPSQFTQEDVDAASQYTADYEAMTSLSLSGRNSDPSPLFDGSMHLGTSLPRSLSYSQFFHLPSRMQYLLDYYDKHVCSVLVAFDSPTNPYRQHVLDLATHNEGLQNAIAALAINNMRMRKHERSPVALIEDQSDSQRRRGSAKYTAPSRPSPEETCYKTVSITQLQMQLADPRNAQDDSILATLLILCLFHVCDSGFSKFKTQLEGVQRLLSMRNPNVRTGFIGWVEMFFTWFDVMTSTVNDRETAIRGDNLDMMQYSSNLGALEQFSGCDGRLFKLIARLGRLNLLSQNRRVRSHAEDRRSSGPQPPPFRYPSFDSSRRQRINKLDPMGYTKLDGNGWAMPIITSSDQIDSPTGDDKQGQDPDSRHEFWSEWNDLRARLRSWTMNEDAADQDISAIHMEPEQREMCHINEMFRSSALLYTERLAYPHLPSSSQRFQVFVRDALMHITSIPVNSCVNKFLLWPLFIAGTECVDANDRAHVRERCIEIQRESGFYNNISVLDVLERVWADQSADAAEGGDLEEAQRRRKDSTEGNGGFGQAFRWRKAMDKVDGEYIIV